MKYLLPCLCLLLAACGSKTNTEQPLVETKVTLQDAPPMAPGKYDPKVPVSTDASQSYALYLPYGYTDTSHMPLIIFFDPHGDGTVPVNMYKELAEGFKYILIGSNNSKNGMSFDQSIPIANSLVTEAKAKYHVDESRIIFSGFSGGAKVALLNGANNKEVDAVIYAGAVVPFQPNHPISLLGFAGTGDLNYSDEILFHHDLPTSINHYLIEWDGSHTWPSAEAFKTAFAWPFSAIPQNKLAVIDDRKLSELVNEDNAKHELVKNIETKDLNWWNKEITDMNASKAGNKPVERMLGFISLACYTYGGQALQQNNLPMAEKIISIYKLVDPTNEDCKKYAEELNKRKKGY